MSEWTNTNFCGCCGRQHRGSSDWWCDKCLKHIKKGYGIAPEERTYFAQHTQPCPFAIPAPAEEERDAHE